MSAAMFFSPKVFKNEFEIPVVNEPTVFEPLKFYCIYPKFAGFKSHNLSAVRQDFLALE